VWVVDSPRRVLVGFKTKERGTQIYTAEPSLSRDLVPQVTAVVRAVDRVTLESDPRGKIMGTYSFQSTKLSTGSDGTETVATMASCAGPAKVVAQAMREVADMLDPPPTDSSMPWWRRVLRRF
jgi:hypothetical protein